MGENKADNLMTREDFCAQDVSAMDGDLRLALEKQCKIVLRDKQDIEKLFSILREYKERVAKTDELIYQKDLYIYNLQKALNQKNMNMQDLSENDDYLSKIFSVWRRAKSFIKNIFKELKRNGVAGVVRRALCMLNAPWILTRSFSWGRKKLLAVRKNKVFGRNAKIAYVIPGVKISGGVAIVLQHANRLKKRGYDVCILTFSEETGINWFKNEVPIISIVKNKPSAFDVIDVMIATHWSTAFWVDLCNAPRRLYFVQSDERRFNPDSPAEIRSITETYKMNLEYMTEAKWIQRWLKEEFDKDAYYVPNGLDEEVFFRCDQSESKSRKARVLLEGPIDCWFKGMEDAYNAVKNLDCEIWIVSSNGIPREHWRYDKFFENVEFYKMNEMYSASDIFLKMSRIEGFFGPPLEAMACGCAVVVGKVTGYDEYIIDGYNALVVEQGDVEGARKAVERLIQNQNLRNKLIRNGYETVKKWRWNKSIHLLEKVIDGEKPEKYYHNKVSERYVYSKEMERLKEVLLEWQR